MKRSDARELAVLLSFSSTFSDDFEGTIETFFDSEHFSSLADEGSAFNVKPDENDYAFIKELVKMSYEHRNELDEYIEKYSQGWRISRISKSALAIMRISMCEMVYMQDTPAAVAINEAVELSKKYEEEKTSSFINGVLGAFYRAEIASGAEK